MEGFPSILKYHHEKFQHKILRIVRTWNETACKIRPWSSPENPAATWESQGRESLKESFLSHTFDLARLVVRYGDDTDGRNSQQVESGRADDGRRAQRSGIEAVTDNLDNGEQNLRRRRAQRHQSQVGNRVVPDAYLDHFRLLVGTSRQKHLQKCTSLVIESPQNVPTAGKAIQTHLKPNQIDLDCNQEEEFSSGHLYKNL